ncbi:MAG: hypothetical protein QME07_05975 [bacterium]|nr:hypothetical protein [bacterium]
MNKKIFAVAVAVYALGFLLLYLRRLFLGPLFIIAGLVLVPISILLAPEMIEKKKSKSEK